jgi:GR25 family glycosyltransferase involved in LPS biosynthesis
MTPVHDVHVISLRRSVQRRDEFLRRNGHLRCTVFDAIDGQELTREQLRETGLFAPALERTYTPGAYGCALSQHALWQRAASVAGPTTIAEDDAVFREDFASAAAAVIAQLPADWDFVLWGWNFDSSLVVQLLAGVSPAAMVFDQRRLRGGIDRFVKLRDPVIPLRLHNCLGTPAYTVSPRGAARLLSLCFPLTELTLQVPLVPNVIPNTGLDIAMNTAFPNLSAWVCFPPLAVTPNDRGTSTVQVPHAGTLPA